jgi:hypothetical protein
MGWMLRRRGTRDVCEEKNLRRGRSVTSIRQTTARGSSSEGGQGSSCAGEEGKKRVEQGMGLVTYTAELGAIYCAPESPLITFKTMLVEHLHLAERFVRDLRMRLGTQVAERPASRHQQAPYSFRIFPGFRPRNLRWPSSFVVSR